jgi:hypothetical protein
MRWAGHVERLGEDKYIQGFDGETRRDHFEDVGVEGKIILNWIFNKWVKRAWDWPGSGRGKVPEIL